MVNGPSPCARSPTRRLPPAPAQPTTKPPATETIARRAGAMVNEIDFPGFVAQLVHGTFDAIVDASIRQMESYSSLVSAVAKTVDQFTEENVTPNQARDWLATRYPGDVSVAAADAPNSAAPQLVPRAEGLTPPGSRLRHRRRGTHHRVDRATRAAASAHTASAPSASSCWPRWCCSA